MAQSLILFINMVNPTMQTFAACANSMFYGKNQAYAHKFAVCFVTLLLRQVPSRRTL